MFAHLRHSIYRYIRQTTFSDFPIPFYFFSAGGEKSSPVGMKPRAVSRPHGAGGGDEGKVWLKPDAASKEDIDAKKKEEGLVNGFASEDSEGGGGKMVNGDGPHDYSVQHKMNGEHSE